MADEPSEQATGEETPATRTMLEQQSAALAQIPPALNVRKVRGGTNIAAMSDNVRPDTISPSPISAFGNRPSTPLQLQIVKTKRSVAYIQARSHTPSTQPRQLINDNVWQFGSQPADSPPSRRIGSGRDGPVGCRQGVELVTPERG